MDIWGEFDLETMDTQKRAELVISLACHMGAHYLLSPQDLLRSDREITLLFLAGLHIPFPENVLYG